MRQRAREERRDSERPKQQSAGRRSSHEGSATELFTLQALAGNSAVSSIMSTGRVQRDAVKAVPEDTKQKTGPTFFIDELGVMPADSISFEVGPPSSGGTGKAGEDKKTVNFVVTRGMDEHSTKLFRLAAESRRIDKIVLQIGRAFELGDAFIASYTQATGNDGKPTESFVINGYLKQQ